MKVAFAGGVTGGHIAPGVALAERITTDLPGSEVLFASVANGTEERTIARRGFRLVRVAARRSGLAAAMGIPGAWLRARHVFASFRPDVVVGLGGAASIGPAVAAIMARTPLILLEGNAVPGRTTRRLASRAAAVCCQYEAAAEALGRRATLTGSPVRAEILAARALDRAEASAFFGLDRGRPTLLVMGGSQGACPINLVMTEAAAELAGERIQIIHLAGEEDAPKLTEAYRGAGIAAHVSGFLQAMHMAYAAADAALSRAGAASIAELAAVGIPAIFVPLPHAKDDHQRANAREAARQGWAELAEQTELNGRRAAGLIREMLTDTARLDAMKRNALASARNDAAEMIINTMLTLSSGGEEVTLAAERNTWSSR